MFCPECGTWNRGSAATCSRCNAKLPDVNRGSEKPDEEITQLRHVTGSRYRVLRRLGGGGMASVYLAEHAHLERPVVLKVLHGHLAKDPEMLERFRREARAASQLVHPNVVPILDAGEAEGVLYTVMPYMPGGSFADRIAQGAQPPVEVASVVAQAATALDYAHRRGVVHRDVKPDNILFDEDGHALMTDFGIAEARFHGRLTASGRAMGTPHYMSPEQAMGKLVDGRADVYSLGIVMYEGLVSFPPFDGPDAFAVGYKQVHEAPVSPTQVSSEVPGALADIVMRCLAKPPAERYATGNDLADALIAWIASTGEAGPLIRAPWTARHVTPSGAR
ncbi:MAG TPA: serine/threonine-protein kinase [Gemmatimonadaceae bacterium]|nr:serine/threonine-protein kinase [Gemmatimonadaceae bacterium]